MFHAIVSLLTRKIKGLPNAVFRQMIFITIDIKHSQTQNLNHKPSDDINKAFKIAQPGGTGSRVGGIPKTNIIGPWVGIVPCVCT